MFRYPITWVKHRFTSQAPTVNNKRFQINIYPWVKLTHYELYSFTYSGNTKIAQLFVQNHANVDVIDNTGETPLLLAVKSGIFLKRKEKIKIRMERKCFFLTNSFRSKGYGWILDQQRCECEPSLSRWFDTIALCCIKRYFQSFANNSMN